MVHINKKVTRAMNILLIVVLGISAYACAPKVIKLPIPEYKCNVDLDWRGLTPGKSTRKDVIEILGQPSKEGKVRFGGRNISFYGYKVAGGEIAKYAMNRIFFRSDGFIDWIEAIEADQDGKFSSVFATVIQLGNKVDTIYPNNNFGASGKIPDVLAGPDEIYVWSSCGLALDALPSTFSPAFQADQKECKGILDTCNLTLRHSSPIHLGGEPSPDLNSIVLMKFYFQPTSYKAFVELYMDKVPYGLWDEYLMENR